MMGMSAGGALRTGRIEITERQRGKENAVSVFDLQRMTGDGMYEICGRGDGGGVAQLSMF